MSAQVSPASLGYLILSDLPRGSEFGLDGQVWNVDRFNGVKMIPPGLHLFVFAAAASTTSAPPAASNPSKPNEHAREQQAETLNGSIGVRHAFLKRYRAKSEGQIVVEKWDSLNESLAYEPVLSTATTKTLSSQQKSKPRRRRKVVPSSSHEDEEESVVVSREYLETLDKHLAPFPQSTSRETRDRWHALSDYVTDSTLARVIGIDHKGIARVDALVEGWREQEELVQAAVNTKDSLQGKTTWGKERPQDEAFHRDLSEERDEAESEPEESEERLQFVKFDDKRSWPPGSVGQELSRWSKDKSWLLSRVVETQLDQDSKELLSELQLSFILFSLVHNFSALSSYKSLFSLICRSHVLTHPSASRPTCDVSPSLLDSSTTLPLFASFLAVIHAQFEFLDSTFFSTQLPSLESHLVECLAQLELSLSDAASSWYRLPPDSPAREIWNTLIHRWNALGAITMEKFGWDLGIVKGSKAKYGQLELDSKRDDRDGDEGIPFEELEEGEDAPVIVDLGDQDEVLVVGRDYY
ncbi:AAR2 splicing factor family protein [Sporobolomyces koalae]|uniref:AAR2 splicing factor family protein n=1 Tax=Sporobolomyces koalae TaxID=500713 RepID=UPI003177ED9C